MTSHDQKLITPSWALNATADNIFTVAKGILEAATSDNVQPIALLAAEAFGGTLAICQQTMIRVEKAAGRRHTSTVLQFLKSSVGYSANDSAAQLSTSSNGIRFLSLTAALLCTSSYSEAAKMLESMIQTSAAKDQPLPTILQLQDLVKALEPKLILLDFPDAVLGWETYFANHPQASEAVRSEIKDNCHPTTKEMNALVEAFRSLGRLGEIKSDGNEGEDNFLVITAYSCFTWIIEFTKWCLGRPPTVIVDYIDVLLEQSGSRVTLNMITSKGHVYSKSASTPPTFQIQLFQSLDSVSQIWDCPEFNEEGDFDDHRQWTGMISPANLAEQRFRYYGLDHAEGLRAVTQALSYALPKVSKHFHGKAVPAKLQDLVLPLFPPHEDIYLSFMKYLSLQNDRDRKFGQLADGDDITSLPLVSNLIKTLSKQCSCPRCTGDGLFSSDCLIDRLHSAITVAAVDILALSLFDSMEQLRVYYKFSINLRDHPDNGNRFPDVLQKIIFGNIEDRLSSHAVSLDPVDDLIRYALLLLGHVPDDGTKGRRQQDWVASAYRGQVVFPIFLESLSIRAGQPLTRLGFSPGMLLYKKCRYEQAYGSLIRGVEPPTRMNLDLRHIHPDKVDGPKNLMSDRKLLWNVSVEDKHLLVSMGLSKSLPQVHIMHLLRFASRSLFVASCPHDKDAKIEPPDNEAFFMTPFYDGQYRNPGETDEQYRERSGKTAVIAVDKNDGFRFLALCGEGQAVIRGGACLECCIGICRQAGLKTVIC